MSTTSTQTNEPNEARDLNRASRPSSGDYEVGYGKPPKHTQFQKGCSGNHSRKRKRKGNMLSLFRRVAAEQVTVNIGGTPTLVSKAAAVLYAIYAKSVQGHSSAVSGFLMLADKANQLPDPSDPKNKVGGFLLVSPTMTQEEWAVKYGTRIEEDPRPA